MFTEWKDLLPETVAYSTDSYAHLSEAQLRRLARYARALWLVETGRDSQDRVTAREIADIRRAFIDEGVDVDWLLSQREAVRDHRIPNSWNPAIVGHKVTLAGLVLPLEWDDTNQFRRFLLAADLGRCSHEAPPPVANQVAYVDVPREVDLSTLGQDQAHGDPCFRVEGVIKFNAAVYQAFRVDGVLRVDASCAIEVTSVLPASTAEIGAFVPAHRDNHHAHKPAPGSCLL